MHKGKKPAHSFRVRSIVKIIELYSSPVTGAFRLGLHANSAFGLQLRGPFNAFVSGRSLTNRLLSVPSFSAYSSSSTLLNIGTYYIYKTKSVKAFFLNR